MKIYFKSSEIKKILHNLTGQWGAPTFSVGVFVGMLAATIASIVESIGDYYATATAANERPPPKHAINRGIAIEGFVSIISGLVGASHATTSYSGTVGFIGITGVRQQVLIFCTMLISIWQIFISISHVVSRNGRSIQNYFLHSIFTCNTCFSINQ